jgi:uncharacterized RmlC-like cupin family protein
VARCACSATRQGLRQPINLSATEPAIAIVARNDPQEQEHVELLALPAPSPR